MKLIVDENIPLADKFFSDLGEIHYKAGRLLTHDDVKEADALLVRSVTQVNESLLSGSQVKFVGSTTIGEDHLDTAYLEARKITYATAPGCNANAVVEYVAAALLEIEQRRGDNLEGKTLAIIGLGNVGSRLKAVFAQWGLNVIACDPILEANGAPDLQSFEAMFAADIISLHTPLTRQGKYPTFHLINEHWLNQLKPEAILINASRGAVIDNSALKSVLENRGDLDVVLDVWEGEPFIDAELAQRVELATPHIAGHSFDGKIKGTEMIYQAFCACFNIEPTKQLSDLMPDSAAQLIDLNEGETIASCRDLVRRVYAIGEDDVNLRSSLMHPKDHRIAAFDQLRKHYRVRREFPQVDLRGVPAFLERISDVELKRIKALKFAI
ncbi:MAG: 4-phosphoerythronate dehydrogenase [Pseudomonadales bacterium]|nr:4-phosphoerythronate dehydrogenase [Pseudomonadales bacterium]